MSVYNSQSSKKWVSFSIAEDSQNLQSLSVNGVFGLVYRPVSTASGKQIEPFETLLESGKQLTSLL